MEIETCPVQYNPINQDQPRFRARIPKVVAMKAYEVYCEVFSPQVEMVTGNCRGGFGAGELIAFLYARTFPREEWRDRMKEAMNGMENI